MTLIPQMSSSGMNFDFEHEDASNLEFGKALTGNAPVLFNAEVAIDWIPANRIGNTRSRRPSPAE